MLLLSEEGTSSLTFLTEGLRGSNPRLLLLLLLLSEEDVVVVVESTWTLSRISAAMASTVMLFSGVDLRRVPTATGIFGSLLRSSSISESRLP